MSERRLIPLAPVVDRRSGDLATRSDVHDLVVAFYREVVFDDLLGPVFEEVAEVDWAEHIPRLIDFWCRVLHGDRTYQGAVMASHRRVHDLEPFRTEHFDRWYALWVATIDDGWSGPLADRAKAHAARVAAGMARHLAALDWRPSEGSR